MKKQIIAALCAIFLLTGCTHDTDISDGMSQANDGETYISETEETSALSKEQEQPEIPGTETEDNKIPENEDIQPATITPDVIFSLRQIDMDNLPEEIVLDDKLAEAISKAIFEQTGLDILARVLYIGTPEYYAGTDLHVEYEAYPKDCEKISYQTRLMDGLQLQITCENGEYKTGIPRVDDKERIETLQSIYQNQNTIPTGAEVSLYLNKENKVCIINNGETIITNQYYKSNVNDLSQLVLWQTDGDTIVLLASESRYYGDPFSIHVSRDGGKTWKETVPELAPLGKNGQHAELGFSDGRIQITESGQIYIFTGTNLASLNILTVPADSDEAVLLFREQIVGYETTALVNAAMISDKRGYVTLTHPRYEGANSIYRTTDGGYTWVRCSVPVPEECTNVWDMRLHMPEVQKEWLEWTMVGTWETGSCTYVSYDGGWTWEIVE